MVKKIVPKKQKSNLVKQPTSNGKNVLSLIGQLEKRTEKQLARFVKDILKIKQDHKTLKEKLDKKKRLPATTTTAKVKKTKPASQKKQKTAKLRIVESANPNM